MVLNRCHQHQINICNGKFDIGCGIKFASYIVSVDVVKSDLEKVATIKKFPILTHVQELRSFLGLTNQLGQFVPNLAKVTVSLHHLLKKGVVYQWLNQYQKDFDKVKDTIISHLVVSFLDSMLTTQLLTDTSKLKYLGYALLQ